MLQLRKFTFIFGPFEKNSVYMSKETLSSVQSVYTSNLNIIYVQRNCEHELIFPKSIFEIRMLISMMMIMLYKKRKKTLSTDTFLSQFDVNNAVYPYA